MQDKIKKRYGWLLVPIIAGICVYFYMNSYSEFEPITYDEHTESFKKIHVDSLFSKNLKIVLKAENVAYNEDRSGKIFIKRKEKRDTEMIWNYTTKALDTAWLNSRNFPSSFD